MSDGRGRDAGTSSEHHRSQSNVYLFLMSFLLRGRRWSEGSTIRYCSGMTQSLLQIEQNSPRITRIDVENNDNFPVEEWIRLGRAIGGNTNITSLAISANHQVDDPNRSEVQDAFCAAMAQNRSIRGFRCTGVDFTSGQIQIMRPFFSHNAQLSEISFYQSALDFEAIDKLTEAIRERGQNAKTIRTLTFIYGESLAVPQSHISELVMLAKECTRLTNLTLQGLSGFDLGSCQAIASFLESEHCMLWRLDLVGNHINDDGCRIIAESLRSNRRLRWLNINNEEITGEGLGSFIPIVCDISSIEFTLNSNHTLEQAYASISEPLELRDILSMNKDTDKANAAKLKVLRYHFNGKFETAMAGLDNKALTYLLAWFGRLKERNSADLKVTLSCTSSFYRIMRCSPELCSYPGFEKLARLEAENQVAALALHNEQLRREANVAKSRIKALEREVEELRSNKRQKV